MPDILEEKPCAISQFKDGEYVKTKPPWTTGKSLSRPDNFTNTNKANWHTSKVEIHTRSKLCHFVGRYVVRAKLFCLKRFRPSHWAGVFIWENFHPGYRDLGNRASPVSHTNTSIFLQRKKRRGEISETEPARMTGLIWRGPKPRHTLGDSRRDVSLGVYTLENWLICGTVCPCD